MATQTKQSKKGDCEVCDKPGVDVWPTPGNIDMCADCKAEDDAIRSKASTVGNIIEHSVKVDTSIEVKSDLFNAATVAAVELKAAIENDESIPADQKEFKYAQMCYDRFLHFQKVAFEKHQEYIAVENEKRAWQVQTQTIAGKLRSEYRDHFKNLNVNYAPTPVKAIKEVAKTRKPKTAAKVSESREAAAKYKVDSTLVHMMVTKRNMSAEDAAKELSLIPGMVKG